jgi:hypothetical protein
MMMSGMQSILGAVEGTRLKGIDNNVVVKIWVCGLSGLIFPYFLVRDMAWFHCFFYLRGYDNITHLPF